jgi:SAM-dependent methyltransferase
MICSRRGRTTYKSRRIFGFDRRRVLRSRTLADLQACGPVPFWVPKMNNKFSLETYRKLRGDVRRLRWLSHDIFPFVEYNRGLEIGAQNHPTAFPEGVHIEYVDYANADEIFRATNREGLVPVNHIWSGSGSLARVCGARDYDFVVACHVIEHVPNVLGWFNGIFEVLRPGGVFNLAIPDYRYTFDLKRKPSSLGEMVEAYLLDYDRPSIRQIFDHTFEALAISPAEPWNESFDVGKVKRYCGVNALKFAFSQSKARLEQGKYLDSHCWVFSPASFLENIEGAIELGLFPFTVNDFQETQKGAYEFYISLRKDADRHGSELTNWQLATVRHLKAKINTTKIHG